MLPAKIQTVNLAPDLAQGKFVLLGSTSFPRDSQRAGRMRPEAVIRSMGMTRHSAEGASLFRPTTARELRQFNGLASEQIYPAILLPMAVDASLIVGQHSCHNQPAYLRVDS